MIVIGLLKVVFFLIQTLLTPIAALFGDSVVTTSLSSSISYINDFIYMISSGFGFAAYFFYWDVISILIYALCILTMAFQTYRLIMWIYNKIPFIH